MLGSEAHFRFYRRDVAILFEIKSTAWGVTLCKLNIYQESFGTLQPSIISLMLNPLADLYAKILLFFWNASPISPRIPVHLKLFNGYEAS